jgi:large subunit ribosomal protein L17
MRHGKKVNHLGRKAAHREALLSNMASSLILNKRITTTVAKAKALRKYVEPLITKAKSDTTHSRRTVFSYLQNKESVKTLFGEVAGKVADRQGGYTRIIKLADVRLGDNAEMCLIELVDFNTLYTKDGAAKKAKTRRSRKGSKKAEGAAEGAETPVAEAATEAKAEKKTKKSTAKKAKE